MQPQTVYTAAELAQAIGVSERTYYGYLSQHLVPEGRRVGRQVFYSTLHVNYGLLIRALVDGGLGLDAVRGIVGHISSTQVLTFASPLAALIEARTRLEQELATATRHLRPADTDLSFQDMRLEDPIALEARISAWDGELRSLSRQLETAFGDVRARVFEHGAAAASPQVSDDHLAELRSDVRALTATLRDLALILAAHFLRDEAPQAAARAAAERLCGIDKLNGGAP